MISPRFLNEFIKIHQWIHLNSSANSIEFIFRFECTVSDISWQTLYDLIFMLWTVHVFLCLLTQSLWITLIVLMASDIHNLSICISNIELMKSQVNPLPGTFLFPSWFWLVNALGVTLEHFAIIQLSLLYKKFCSHISW